MHVPDKPAELIKMPKPPEGAKWAEPARVVDSTIYRFNAAGYLKPGYQQGGRRARSHKASFIMVVL
jgi:acylaminoacyl-peptidase